MQIIRHKKLYLPAFSIIAVVLLLIFLVAVLTYRTLDHQRKTALTFLHSQGVTLLHALEAGALTGMLMPMWNEDSVKTLIHVIGKDKNIAYIFLYDQHGTVTHASGISEGETRAGWRPELKNDDQVVARLRKLDNGSLIYELAKRFSPESLVPSGKTGFALKRARTCYNMQKTRLTGTHGGLKHSPVQQKKANRFSCLSAMPPATGAM